MKNLAAPPEGDTARSVATGVRAPRGLGVVPPRGRGGKMRQVEVTQALRRRPVTRPARPISAAAPGAGTMAKSTKVPLLEELPVM